MEERAGKAGRGWEGQQGWGASAQSTAASAITFSETLRAHSMSSFLVKASLGLHCRAPALVTRAAQPCPSSCTRCLMWAPICERMGKGDGLYKRHLDLHCAWRSHEGPNRTCTVD